MPRDELRHLLRARLPGRHELGGLPSLRVVQQRTLQPGQPLQRLEALQPLQPRQALLHHQLRELHLVRVRG